ncbi:MAG: nitroreductase family deazaflavin-dependent oxidoreductase [Acidimicrobiales bacterium]
MSEPSYTPPDLTLVGEEHIRRYLETDGEVGHDWNGVPILILTTTGRRSGEPRRSALIYGQEDGRHVIIASQGGAPTHPNWYHNLTANPHVEVQVRGDRFRARARTAEDEERDRLWSVMTTVWPNYDVYQTRTDRRIPVVVLDRA